MPEIKLIPRNPIRAALGLPGIVFTFTLWSLLIILRKLFFLPERIDSKLIGYCADGVMKCLELTLRTENKEIYDANIPAIVIANHSSIIDIPCVYHATSTNLRMLSKREMFWFPIMGWAMKISKHVPIHRGSKDSGAKARRNLGKVLNSGYQIWIAPEGTRSSTGCLLPFKKGAFHIAVQQNVPIYVLALYKPWEILPKGKLYSSVKGEVVARFLGRLDPKIDENSVKKPEDLLAEARKLYLSNGFVEC